jgi:hypothetical protein
MVQPKLEDTTGLLVAIAMFRGIYTRVAARAGVHQTFVSLVIHGKRKSPDVIEAMRYELTVIRDYLNRTTSKTNGA